MKSLCVVRRGTWLGLRSAGMLLGLSGGIALADFDTGAPTEETVSSIGVFRIAVHPDFDIAPVNTLPGYQAHPVAGVSDNYSRLTSPMLFDDKTTIGRSKSHPHGAPGVEDVAGGDTVQPSDFAFPPPAFTSGVGGSTREIFTSIKAFNLQVNEKSCRPENQNTWGHGVPAGLPIPDGTVVVRAGLRPNLNTDTSGIGRKSPGQVQSKSPSGLPVNDFPAQSFFEIFVEVYLVDAAGTILMTLHNTSPMLVQNDDVNALPPKVVYIHGGSQAVAVYVKGGPFDGKLFGWLTLAGHGLQFSCDPAQGGGQGEIYNFLDTVFSPNGIPRRELPVPGAVPIPTVSEWGLIILALLLLTAGVLALRTRRPALIPA